VPKLEYTVICILTAREYLNPVLPTAMRHAPTILFHRRLIRESQHIAASCNVSFVVVARGFHSRVIIN
jgi:hypothetical protein